MEPNTEKYLNLLMHYHDNQIDLLKHYEDHRTRVSQILLTLSAALIGLSKIVSTSNVSIFTVSILIIALGLAGVLFTLKYTSLANKRTTLARKFRSEISTILVKEGMANFEELYQNHSNSHSEKLPEFWRIVLQIKLRHCWIALHVLIMLIGLSLFFGNI